MRTVDRVLDLLQRWRQRARPKAEARARVKGIVHDASGSGQTLFIEPFVVVELGNAWREAQVAEAEEIARILTEQESRARELISKHLRGLELIAEALLEHETIDGPRVAALIQQALVEAGSTESISANVMGTPG